MEGESSHGLMSGALSDGMSSSIPNGGSATFPLASESLIAQVPCSKIFIFSNDRIYVVLSKDFNFHSWVDNSLTWRELRIG